MTDVLTKEQRHLNMSHIRGKDTSIEVKLRKALKDLSEVSDDKLSEISKKLTNQNLEAYKVLAQ